MKVGGPGGVQVYSDRIPHARHTNKPPGVPGFGQMNY